MNTPVYSLLQHLGMLGSSGTRTGQLVPQPRTPDSDQELFREFQRAGQVADPDIWSRFNSYMRRPVTFDSMLQLWDEMAGWDLMAAALVEIVDEATQTDQSSPGTIWYECNDRDFEEDLNNMLVKVDAETAITSQIYYTAAMGNAFEKIEYEPNNGVLGFSMVHPFDIRRYWLVRNRRCIGFRWVGEKPDKKSAFVMPDNKTPVERVSISDGKDIEELWYPWDFLHFRRMYRLRISEHGEPVFDEAQGIYKKLRLAIDQMVVHRAQVQPDRYAINVDVKDQVPVDQMKTIQRWKQMLRSKIAFGQNLQGSTGQQDGLTDPQGFQSFYNAWALDTILWVARPTGFEHSIEKLQGTQNVPDVYDIELLTDLFFSIIGMPRSWFGARTGNSEGTESASGKALLAQDMRFLRKIKSIRRPIIQCYTWLGYFHALLKGKDVRQLEIKAVMPPIGSLEDQMKLEMLQQQAEVLDRLADVMEKYSLPKEAWIETIFKKYLHLPDDVVAIFLTALPAEVEGQPLESKKPAPSSAQIIQELEGRLDSTRKPMILLKEAHEALKSGESKRVRKMTVEDVVQTPIFKDFDLIVSSYGRNPFEWKKAMNGEKHVGRFETKTKKPLTEAIQDQEGLTGKEARDRAENEPAYRKFLPEKM